MKIKYILFGLALSMMLTIGTAMAEDPVEAHPEEATAEETAVRKNDDYCKNKGDKSVYDTGIKDCMSGIDFCEKYNPDPAPEGFEYAWDDENRLCYLNNTDTNIGQFSILPYTKFSVAECEDFFSQDALSGGTLMKKFLSGESDDGPVLKKQAGTPSPGQTTSSEKPPSEEISKLDVLGCGIKTGRMKLWMIPYYIKSLVRFALSIAGLVAIGAMVIGGYFYMFGTLMDDKERGKRSIIYGLAGFVVVLLAWAIVNVVISIATM